jgi:ferredoxin
MAEPLHVVDHETCRGDGICVAICPEDILEIVDDKAATAPERADACIQCGQCVAVCPTESIRMPSLDATAFEKLGGQPVGYDAFLQFLRHRRSVRVFKDKPVEREQIERILEAAVTAPMGFPPHTTEVLVIDRREELEFLLKELVKDYASMLKAFSSPIGRAMVRLGAGAETYRMLKDKIVGLVEHANEAFHEDGRDEYMYGAPALLLFHASRWGMEYEENAHLVCHHAMLAALSLGLGTTIIGLIPPIVNRSKVLRKRYGIPKDNRALTCLILGYPKFKYRQGIRRELAGVRYV